MVAGATDPWVAGVVGEPPTAPIRGPGGPMMRYSRFSAADDTSPSPNALTTRAIFNEFRAAGVEVGCGSNCECGGLICGARYMIA